MSKERLQDIKKKYNYERLGEFIDVEPVNPYELKWLIQQAERVQELEEDLTKYRNGFEFQLLINNSIKKQNKRYREAIKKGINATRYTNPEVAYILGEALEGEE